MKIALIIMICLFITVAIADNPAHEERYDDEIVLYVVEPCYELVVKYEKLARGMSPKEKNPAFEQEVRAERKWLFGQESLYEYIDVVNGYIQGEDKIERVMWYKAFLNVCAENLLERQLEKEEAK